MLNWKLAPLIALIMEYAPTALAQNDCRMSRFLPIGCSTPNGLKLTGSVTSSNQYSSIGCVELTPGTAVKVIEKIGEVSWVSITTPTQVIPFWVNSMSLDCTVAKPAVASPEQSHSAYDQTKDGYVWKGGKRVGWVDTKGQIFYLMNQLAEVVTPPVIKTGEAGWKIEASLHGTIAQAEQGIRPPPFRLEQTGDGFVWRESNRIGWVDKLAALFYRNDQLEIVGGKAPVPKPGEVGFKISSDDLVDAVVRAERRN